MSPSAKLQKLCLYCNKAKSEISHANEGPDRVITLECGHTIVEELVVSGDAETTLRDNLINHVSSRGKKLRPFQVEGVLFASQANFRVGIFDEMGLGKTAQACLALKYAPQLLPAIVFCRSMLKAQWLYELVDWTGLPAQIIYSSKDKPISYFKIFIVSLDTADSLFENEEWKALEFNTIIIDECQLIKNVLAKRTKAVQNLAAGRITRKRVFSNTLNSRPRIEMMARDLLSYHRLDSNFELNFEDLGKHKLGLTECRATNDGIIKGRITISTPHAEHGSEESILETILHEIAHAITPGAGHRPIWSDTCRSIGGNGEEFANCMGSQELVESFSSQKHVIALSGTPINNNSLEYFPVLNMLSPENFRTKDGFERRFVDHIVSGRFFKPAGIKPYMVKEFREVTKDIIIRRTRAEVMPELPKINRTFRHIDLPDDTKSAWNKALAKFAQFYDDIGGEGFNAKEMMGVLEWLSRLRHLTGLAKCDAVAEDAVQFLTQTDRKLTIFYHHSDVGQVLYNRLAPICAELGIDDPLLLNPQTPNRDVYSGNCARFGWVVESSNHRLLIASTLANSEGLNLQQCSDMIQVERQWNPSKEEQAEARFPRPGSIAQSIGAIYATAIDTIDEWFGELVEKKRVWVAQTMGDDVNYAWEESSLVRELANICAQKGRKTWNPQSRSL
jgi:hypothetical protein